MISGWDKAWIPMLLSVVAVLAYQGLVTEQQVATMNNFISVGLVPLVQGILVWLTPNKVAA